jgi:hypothetical protein
MLNFDRTNQDHIILVVGILKHISEDKCIKCFRRSGVGTFNVSSFNRKIGNNDSTHTIVTKRGKSKNNGEEFLLTSTDKTKIETYFENETFTVNDDSFSYRGRLDLETAFSKIQSTNLLPIELAERVWKEVFSVPEKKIASPALPENVLTAEVCEGLEFKSNNLVTSVITGTLQWAYDNSAKIIEAAKNRNCQFRYIITSSLALPQLKAFKEQVEKAELSDKIKFANIENLYFKVNKKNQPIQTELKIPIANDIVFYSSENNAVIQSRPKFIFITERKKLKSIALVGTFPQGYDFLISSYYDILMSKNDGLRIYRWFSNTWENLTGEEYEF